jgi:hypothetical protein
MATLLKEICRFNENSPQISRKFFIEIEKYPKMYMNVQKTPNTKAVLVRMSNAGTITIPNFKLHNRVIITKIAWS